LASTDHDNRIGRMKGNVSGYQSKREEGV